MSAHKCKYLFISIYGHNLTCDSFTERYNSEIKLVCIHFFSRNIVSFINMVKLFKGLCAVHGTRKSGKSLLEVNCSKELQCVSIAHADEGVTTYFTAAVG